jgi:lipoyl(octanoyl) transferase
MMWRLLHSTPASGADNMALDEALMQRARETGEWTLRVYSWSRPTLSLGRNQAARGGYDLGALAARNVDIVRRPTGGRAILHHREVTYSVTAPLSDAGELGESYARINRLLVTALRELGVDAVVAGDTDTHDAGGEVARAQPALLPCFHHPSIGEIMTGGRKLAGSAQWRCDGALLQHGSILVDDDQVQLASFMIVPPPPLPAPATLHETLGRLPSEREVADALFCAVRALEDSAASELEPDPMLAERADVLRSRYLDEAWTWRR